MNTNDATKVYAWLDQWGDAVGPGWRKILQAAVENMFMNGWDGSTAQVKEKFGMLRFYIGGMSPHCDMAEAAEFASQFICEQCGEAGRLRCKRGWWKTVCTKCER